MQEKAKSICQDLSVDFVGQVGELKDYFLVASAKKQEHPHHLHKRLYSTQHVKWVKQQILERRIFKRDEPSIQIRQPRPQSDFVKLGIYDPGFPSQWHLNNVRDAGNDINVYDVWSQGITGKGVVVAFLDDGIDYDHPDLKDNFYAEGSYDFNEHKKLPSPKLFDDKHGTRCAGEVAAARNSLCGVGIAWDTKVSGIRILSGTLTEADEAASVNYDYQNNHIYSCSWGPRDDGKTMEAPPQIVRDAFYNGIVNGRGGLGSIFVFATGNGANSGDNCNFDGYTNSIYTITVGAIDRLNQHPPYSEECSAQIGVTYSSGQGSSIFTSDWPSTCTDNHGGTSAAAPIASGMLALVMGIRPELTWRDFQQLSIMSAVPITTDDGSWQKVAKERMYSHRFGYGKFDSSLLIKNTKEYKLLGPQTIHQSPNIIVNSDIPNNANGISSLYEFTSAIWKAKRFVKLEHITVTIHITHQRRGDVEVILKSPNGYISRIGPKRPGDTNPNGYTNWTFMTVVHWEENPIGKWQLSVLDTDHPDKTGKLDSWYITFWGEGNGNNSSSLPSNDGSVETPIPNQSNDGESNHPISIITIILILGILGIIGYIIYKRKQKNKQSEYRFEFLPGHSNSELEAAFGSDDDEYELGPYKNTNSRKLPKLDD